MSKTVWQIIGVIVLVLVLIVLLPFISKDKGGNDNATTTPDNGTTDTLKTYSDPGLGLSFQYPALYLVATRDSGTPVQPRRQIMLIDDTAENRELLAGTTTVPREGPPAITFDIFQNLEARSPREWVTSSNTSNFNLSPDGLIASTTVGTNVSAVTYRWSGLYEGRSVVFGYNTNLVMASVTWLLPSDRIVADFDAILRSLRLTGVQDLDN